MKAPLHHPPNDARRIDVADPTTLFVWAERLNVETDELRDAVAQVGDDAEAVELVLKGSLTVTAH